VSLTRKGIKLSKVSEGGVNIPRPWPKNHLSLGGKRKENRKSGAEKALTQEVLRGENEGKSTS